jgi:hypothetical protein
MVPALPYSLGFGFCGVKWGCVLVSGDKTLHDISAFSCMVFQFCIFLLVVHASELEQDGAGTYQRDLSRAGFFPAEF